MKLYFWCLRCGYWIAQRRGADLILKYIDERLTEAGREVARMADKELEDEIWGGQGRLYKKGVGWVQNPNRRGRGTVQVEPIRCQARNGMKNTSKLPIRVNRRCLPSTSPALVRLSHKYRALQHPRYLESNQILGCVGPTRNSDIQTQGKDSCSENSIQEYRVHLF